MPSFIQQWWRLGCAARPALITCHTLGGGSGQPKGAVTAVIAVGGSVLATSANPLATAIPLFRVRTILDSNLAGGVNDSDTHVDFSLKARHHARRSSWAGGRHNGGLYARPGHAYSSERRYALKIPASVPFTEDATYWNPSWTITHGAIETTNINDMHTSAVAIGTGRLLKPATFQQMITKDLIGKTTKVKGCLTCFPQQPAYTYGLGIVSTGNWLVQDPLFSGESGAIAYLPSQQVAIALTVTYEPAAFTSPASPKNSADYLWRVIAAKLAPADAQMIPPDAQ